MATTSPDWLRQDIARLKAKVKDAFLTGDALTRTAFVCAAVYIVTALTNACLRLAGLPVTWVEWLALPASLPVFITRPWTLATYMFLHYGFLHLLFNLLTLLWCARLLQDYFTGRRLFTIFLAGGMAGAAVFWIGYYAIPHLVTARAGSSLVGASAGIMALIGTAMTYTPERRVRFPLFGEIRIFYVCLALFALSLAGGLEGNPGGTLAHLGGFVTGAAYGAVLRKSLNGASCSITEFFQRLLQRMCQFKKKNHPHSPKEDANKRKRSDPGMEAILEKVRRSGYDSLTAEEKRKLFQRP